MTTTGRPDRPRRRPALAATAALLATAGVAFAGVDRWSALGPDGGDTAFFAIDPHDSETLYLVPGGSGRDAGLYRSFDGGERWDYLRRAGYFTGELIDSLMVDPHDPKTLYAHVRLTDIERSTDGGRTWSLVLADAAYSFAVDPVDSKTLYALTHDYGFQRSADGGATWQVLADGIVYNLPGTSGGGTGWAILVVPTEPRTIYIGYSYGTLRSLDGGSTWEVIGPTNLEAYAFAATDPRVLFARSTFGGCGARSEDGGATFVRIPDPPGTYCAAFAFDPGSPRRLYAATGYDSSQLLVTEDDGASWSPRGSGLPGKFGATFLKVDPADSNRLYLGTDEDGLLASRDGGRTWQYASQGFTNRASRWLAAVGDPPVFFAADHLLHRSSDFGRTWTVVGATDPESAFVPFQVIEAPGKSGRLYAAEARGVWISGDRGQNWSLLSESGPSALRCIAVDPRHPRTLYAGGVAGVSKSTDGGLRWAPASEGIVFREPCDAIYCFPPTVTVLLVDPSRSATLYLIWDSHLYVSRDGAAQWSLVAAGLPATIATLALDGSGRLYAGSCGGVFRSDDGAATWKEADQGLRNGEAPPCVTSLAAAPGDPSTLAAATEGGGVFRTLDGGESWTPVEGGLPARYISEVAWDPSTPGRLYASTDGAGLITTRLVDAPTVTIGDRFHLAAAWRYHDRAGAAAPAPFSSRAATFSYFDAAQPDLAVKLLDGRGVNGHTWWFGASLSHAEGEVTIVDEASGDSRTYFFPAGGTASAADVTAFAQPPWAPADAPSDTAAAFELRLLGGRFRVETEWRGPDGAASAAQAVALSDGAGAFVFFAPENPEVVVKLIDGRALNGKFWLFTGGLSSLEYRITVTDLETGASRQFTKPAGELASFADTAAF
jgi:photosystem II stability/assembly factor-like uncharacterized protein